MKKNWTNERKWEKSKHETQFEKLLLENDFEIIGFKEFNSKTTYLISKDGVKMETDLPHDKKIDIKGCIEFVKKSHETTKRMEELENKLNRD